MAGSPTCAVTRNEPWTLGWSMERGFRDCGLGLKKAAESAVSEEERA
jgi:hypothetical protein